MLRIAILVKVLIQLLQSHPHLLDYNSCLESCAKSVMIVLTTVVCIIFGLVSFYNIKPHLSLIQNGWPRHHSLMAWSLWPASFLRHAGWQGVRARRWMEPPHTPVVWCHAERTWAACPFINPAPFTSTVMTHCKLHISQTHACAHTTIIWKTYILHIPGKITFSINKKIFTGNSFQPSTQYWS